MLSKFVVVEVSSTPSTMTLVEYLVTHGFDKFAVVTDLMDHPSFKTGNFKDGSSSPESPSTTVSTGAQHTPPRTAISTPTSMSTPVPSHQNKPRASIDSIAQALSSKKTSPTPVDTPQRQQQMQYPLLNIQNQMAVNNSFSQLHKIIEEQQQKMQQKKEHERQQAEIHRILLQTQLNPSFGIERLTPDYDDNQHSETISKASSEDLKTEVDTPDFGLGTSDEQVRASMIHLLNPAFGSAFGLIDSENIFGTPNTTPTAGSKRKAAGEGGTSKKHRWLPVDELEESRSSRGKNCGRVHCKATYKCALCGKPTTLNSTGSRWNLLRHVIMIHSDCKPYKCWDCDFTGIKSNVISHARQCRHRADDAHDITTDEMRQEWNLQLQECFPDYVKAKERGWQPEETPEKKPDVLSLNESVTLVKQEPVELTATTTDPIVQSLLNFTPPPMN